MLLRIDPKKIDERELDKAVDCLRDGGVIIYPTDTVYAYGCHIENVKGIERIARIKHIAPEKSNFSIVCNDLSLLADFTKPISNSLFRLMKKNLPGPFTFVLPAGNKLPKTFREKKKTIGIRVPANAIAQYLVEKLEMPLISASVHTSEEEVLDYYTEPEELYEQNKGYVDLMIDGGYGNLVPSTVVDCCGEEVELIRQGLGILKYV
jgi:tRNA threonylcarbamoyl adenosine modification protein (Sua5/YciO/YrdC/YwlC family)